RSKLLAQASSNDNRQAHVYEPQTSPSQVAAMPLVDAPVRATPVIQAGPAAVSDGVRTVSRMDWMLITVALLWLAGVMYYLAPGLKGALICRRIVGSSIPLDLAKFDGVLTRLRHALQLKTLPVISVSSRAGSPAVIGTFRPQIVLPASAVGWMSLAQLFQ